MANVTTSPNTLILDTAATIKATGNLVKITGITFTGTVLELQDGATRPIVRFAGAASIDLSGNPLVMNGLIVAAGVTGTATLFLG